MLVLLLPFRHMQRNSMVVLYPLGCALSLHTRRQALWVQQQALPGSLLRHTGVTLAAVAAWVDPAKLSKILLFSNIIHRAHVMYRSRIVELLRMDSADYMDDDISHMKQASSRGHGVQHLWKQVAVFQTTETCPQHGARDLTVHSFPRQAFGDDFHSQIQAVP